jgi:hypothetical protein
MRAVPSFTLWYLRLAVKPLIFLSGKIYLFKYEIKAIIIMEGIMQLYYAFVHSFMKI